MEQEKKRRRTLYEVFFKRLFDVVLSLIALIVLSPIMLIIAVINWITLKGRAIFAQYRPGKNGKIFKLYKFRSMSNKKDKSGKLLPDNQRLTKFGKFIRKLSLDELPQLFNILKGDMSIIGPRPRLVKDMIFYDEQTLKAYNVRPGLTGLAQVSGGRSYASWEEIFELDAKYSSRITFFGDVKIFFKTIGVLFKSDAGNAGNSKRDYYYPDYLLKTDKITKDQYNQGIRMADEIIKNKGKVDYQSRLHKRKKEDKQ